MAINISKKTKGQKSMFNIVLLYPHEVRMMEVGKRFRDFEENTLYSVLVLKNHFASASPQKSSNSFAHITT